MIPINPSSLALFDALVRSETFLWGRVEKELRVTEQISLVELTTLRAVLAVGPGARVKDLVNLLGITVGAASKAVDRLENAGLAARSPAVDDRRSSLITLTDRGLRVVADGETAVGRAMAPIIEAVDFDVAAVTASLQELQQHTSDLMSGAVR